MTALLLKIVGTKKVQKLAISIVKVIVKRTDNKWDDEILDLMLSK